MHQIKENILQCVFRGGSNDILIDYVKKEQLTREQQRRKIMDQEEHQEEQTPRRHQEEQTLICKHQKATLIESNYNS